MKRKEAVMARKIRKGRLAIVVVGLLLSVAICLFLLQQCASCVGGLLSDEDELLAEAPERQGEVEFVQLLYNGKVKIPCKVPRCEFTMKKGESFKMIGVKLIEEKKVTPVGKKPRNKAKEAKKTGEEVVPVSIELVGEDVSFPHAKRITIKDIAKTKSSDFVFVTPYGEVFVDIWGADSQINNGPLRAPKKMLPSRKQYNRMGINTDLNQYKGKRAHLLVDASGSMGPMLKQVWPIASRAFADNNIKMVGLSWYANLGEVWHSKSTTMAAWSREVIRGRVSHREASIVVYEAPSPALEEVARKFKPDVIVWITNEGQDAGGITPNTNGIPVYGIAICHNKNFRGYRGAECVREVRAITRFTNGKFKQVDPIKSLGMSFVRSYGVHD